MISKAKLQNHFYISGLVSNLITPAQEDDLLRDFVVADKKATSNEYYVAEALTELGFQYEFQMSFAGGKVAFGMVLDFLVYTVPLPTPVWVHGEHWHMGDRRAKDIRQMQLVEEMMGGQINIPVEIWGSESEDKASAMRTVRSKLL